MLNKIFLVMVGLILISCSPVSATNLIINGDFETGNLNGWSTWGTVDPWTISSDSYEGTYSTASDYGIYENIKQTIDFTEVSTVTFYSKVIGYSFGDFRFGAYMDSTSSTLGTCLWSAGAGEHDWTLRTIDVSGYTGYHTINFFGGVGTSGQIRVRIDNIMADDGIGGADEFITWTTCPTDSWAKGNYSMIWVRVPEEHNNFTFWYKTPSTDYTQISIPKNYLHNYPAYNYVDDTWYYHYWKTCYHAVHGNYSAKLIIDGSDSSEITTYIPYLDLDVDMPDVITIPVPDVFIDPPQWNVTIPEAYINVSWLTNYTDFWDGLGESINTTQYATVGLLLIPFDALNTSLSGVYGYVDDASGMVQGFDHCALIVRAGWDVIPNEIQTIFIGSAALGIVVFIYHRRA